MMKLYHVNIKCGFTFRPFVFLPKGIKQGGLEHTAYMAHERTHYQRQGQNFPFRWLYRYITDRQFRLEEECAAYRQEVRYRLFKKMPVNKLLYASLMSTEYRKMCSFNEALEFVNGVINEYEGI